MNTIKSVHFYNIYFIITAIGPFLSSLLCFSPPFFQMTKHFLQENKNSSFTLFSTSECIAWLTLVGMASVGIVMLNALVITVYLKVRSLRKRSMNLVINQVVADMSFGGCVITRFCFLGKRCKFWSITFLNFPSLIAFQVWYRCILFATGANLAAISVEKMHATFRPSKHRIIKRKMFGALLHPFGLHLGSTQRSLS